MEKEFGLWDVTKISWATHLTSTLHRQGGLKKFPHAHLPMHRMVKAMLMHLILRFVTFLIPKIGNKLYVAHPVYR